MQRSAGQGSPLLSHSLTVKLLTGCLIILAAIGALFAINFVGGSAAPDEAESPGITLGLTGEAREALLQSGQAFPSATAGFSTYYRVPAANSGGGTGSYGLAKSTVDDRIFGRRLSSVVGRRPAPAVILDLGANYTVASMPLYNIGGLITTVRVYYDDEGWIVAYLPRGVPPSQIWQARELDDENPSLSDISETVFLDAINVILADGLGGDAIDHTAEGLGYYHWQYPAADSFLMMAVVQRGVGLAPVSFAVPELLNIKEVSATLWLTENSGINRPCATLTLGKLDLIPKKCSNGFYNTFLNPDDFNSLVDHSQVAYLMKLTHSEHSGGASGALLMLVYSQGETVASE